MKGVEVRVGKREGGSGGKWIVDRSQCCSGVWI